MNGFSLYTDSTADLSQKLVDLTGVTVIPTEFFVQGRRYLDFPDEREMSKERFFEILRGGEMPTTAVIPPSRFYEYFEDDVKNGVPILYIVFSSGLTTTRQNALIAVEDLKENYPDADIHIVDSLSASLGEGGLVYYAGMMKKEGRSRDEVESWLAANRLKVHVLFTVDDLAHLRRGGRLTAAAAAVGGVLGIKPLLYMDNSGRLVPIEKVRGRKAALEALVRHAAEHAVNPREQTLFVAHAGCIDDAVWLQNQLLAVTGAREVSITAIGPVIGTHTGPGCIGCSYMAAGR